MPDVPIGGQKPDLDATVEETRSFYSFHQHLIIKYNLILCYQHWQAKCSTSQKK